MMSAAAPPAAVVKLMHGVMAGLAAGRALGEVVYSLLTGGGGSGGASAGVLDEFELAHLRACLQVWGAPGLLGAVLTQGNKAAKGAKK